MQHGQIETRHVGTNDVSAGGVKALQLINGTAGASSNAKNVCDASLRLNGFARQPVDSTRSFADLAIRDDVKLLSGNVLAIPINREPVRDGAFSPHIQARGLGIETH